MELKELITTFQNHLYLEQSEIDTLTTLMAVILSHEIQGDPVWLFLVAPPGSTKSEFLRSLKKLKNTMFLSSLTPNSLISGLRKKKDDDDPSLVKKLNNKILIIKDFTNILGLRNEAKTEILATLRDLYDGFSSKSFGNIGLQEYTARFTCIAGVTPEIDRQASTSQMLGERFLKMRPTYKDRNVVIQKAHERIGDEEEMRNDLQDGVVKFIDSHPVDRKMLPIMPLEIKNKLIYLANFLSWGRTGVARHWKDQAVEYAPSREIGTRLVKQLTKVALGLAIANDRNTVTLDDYNLTKTIAENSLPAKTMLVIQTLFRETAIVAQSTSDIAVACRMDTESIKLQLEDLGILEVAVKDSSQINLYRWSMNPEFRDLMEKCGTNHIPTAPIQGDLNEEIPF